MKDLNYYENQLSKLELTESMQVKVFDGEGNSTNYLTLNVESISALEEFLKVLKKDLLDVIK